MLIRHFPPVASMEKPPPVHNLPWVTTDRILVLSSRRNSHFSGAERGKKPHRCFKASAMRPNRLAHAKFRNRKRGPLFSSTYRGIKIAEEDTCSSMRFPAH
jgi:hypothetical protein